MSSGAPAASVLYLVRHARALDRSRWERPDRERPLSARGRGEAEEIATRLGTRRVARILSSPAARCVETVEPLARALDRGVELAAWLVEGSDPNAALGRLLEITSELAWPGELVACSHGDVLDAVMEHLLEEGVELDAPAHVPKAGIVELGLEGGRTRSASRVLVGAHGSSPGKRPSRR